MLNMKKGFIDITIARVLGIISLLGLIGVYAYKGMDEKIKSSPFSFGAPVSNIFRNLIPETDNTYELGTTTKRWKELYTQTASTTNLLISGLSGCDTLDTQSDGTVVCGTDASGAGGGLSFYDAFTHPVVGTSATTSNIQITGASTTLQNFTFVNATGTSATSTNLNISGGLSFNGVISATWAGFCNTITGGAGLCDGDDATGGSGGANSKWATSTGLNSIQPNSATGIIVTGATTTNATTTNQNYTAITNKVLAVDSTGNVIGTTTISTNLLNVKSFVVTTASPLGGAATVNLGDTLALTCTGCLTANQTITLTGDVTGSGATSILTSIAPSARDWKLFSPSILQPTTTPMGIYVQNSTSTITNLSMINSTSTNATTTNFNVSGNLDVDGLTSALTLTGSGGVFAEYTGASCTNQFVRVLSALGVATCATVGAADVSLADLTATNATLTFSGTYTGATARTIGLNLGNANTWTATQTFSPTIIVQNTTSNIGLGTTTPYGYVSIGTHNLANATPSFIIASSSTGVATSSVFEVYGNSKAGLGIGTTTAGQSATLAVNPVAGNFSNRFVVGSSSATSMLINNSGNVFMAQLSQGTAANDAVCISATFELIQTTNDSCVLSSKRFKHDILDLSSGLLEVLKLRPVTYELNDSDRGVQVGFIAEEVMEIDPRLVSLDKEGLPFSVRYQNFTAMLTKAIQELYIKTDDRITVLEKRLDILETENRMLKNQCSL